MRAEDTSHVVVADMPGLSSRHRIRVSTHQIIQHWKPFTDLKHTFAVSRRAEQLRLRTQQRIIDTTEDSILKTEMGNLESPERMSLNGSFDIRPWVGWGRSGLITEMRPGLLVSDRLFLPCPLDHRFRLL